MNQRSDLHPALEFLATRRSVPVLAMRGPGPAPAELEILLRVASRVPDHGKLAPWRFIVFEGEARERAGRIIAARFTAKTPDATDQQIDIERKRLIHAPLVVAVVSRASPHAKIPEWEQILSAGAVCMNLVTAANAMGFVTSWLTQWYAYDDETRAAFGIAPNEKIAGFVHIGRRDTKPDDRERPSLDAIVTRF